MGFTESSLNSSAAFPPQINGDPENLSAHVPSPSQYIIGSVAWDNNSDAERNALLRVISNALDTLASIPSQHYSSLEKSGTHAHHLSWLTNTNLTHEARRAAENNLLHRVANYLRREEEAILQRYTSGSR